MKSIPRVLPLFVAAYMVTAAHAQYGSTPIKHVVVIFQENRTPDNLFQGLCAANGGVPGCSTTGAGGTYEIASTYVDSAGQTVPLTPVGLATNFDLDHSHGGPKLNGTISGFNFEFDHQGIKGRPAANVPTDCGANVYATTAPLGSHGRTATRVDLTGPPGFEPGFEAPEASVMSKLYYGPGPRAEYSLS